MSTARRPRLGILLTAWIATIACSGPRAAQAQGAEVRRRLAALDEAGLKAALADLVSARGRKAILERRDALLALPAFEDSFLGAHERPDLFPRPLER